MDPLSNPYAPGAGTQPPELAGRDHIRENIRVALGRIRLGRSAKSGMLLGLRGVGKTVLLDSLRLRAEQDGFQTARVEAPESRSLPAILAPEIRRMLLAVSRVEQAKDAAATALRALAGFVSALRVRFDDVEVVLDAQPEPGLADSGDFEFDLQHLMLAVAAASKRAGTAGVIFADELQYVEESQLAALITALHRAAQEQAPITLVGAGLPMLRGRLGKAKSYAERLFEFHEIGPLSTSAAEDAIVLPARANNVEFDRLALDEILARTHRYPYFLQEWGKHSWEVADASPIGLADVRAATRTAVASLDSGFFSVRFDRLSPSEKRYVRAMAEMGHGPHRSGDIADMLGRKVESLAPTRAKLIEKGMVWSPSHGETAFTVPMFDEFLERIMPGDDWRTR